MLTLEEMKSLKQTCGYSNQWIADKTGIPLATVMKIFGGTTKTPRHETLLALEKAFRSGYGYPAQQVREGLISEPVPAFRAGYKPYRRQENMTESTADLWPDQGSYTEEDYFALPENVRAELIDGRFYLMSAPSYVHQEILGQLYMQFQECASMHGENCRVYFSPMNVQLDQDDRTMVQPDLIMICETKKLKKNVLSGAPDLAVEIVSPSSRSYDAILKLNKYMRAGVKEYWLVDPDFRTVNVYRMGGEITMKIYTFDDRIPVGISDGKCEIDFSVIDKRLRLFDGE